MYKKHLILILIIVLLSLFSVSCDKRLQNASKDEIINVFKSNKEDFFTVQEHLETIQGYLYSYADPQITDHVSIDNRMYALQDDTLQECIDIITKQLHFDGIYGTGDGINFVADPGDPNRGIIYSKDKIVPDRYNLPTVEPIIDGWYYYEAYEMGGI